MFTSKSYCFFMEYASTKHLQPHCNTLCLKEVGWKVLELFLFLGWRVSPPTGSGQTMWLCLPQSQPQMSGPMVDRGCHIPLCGLCPELEKEGWAQVKPVCPGSRLHLPGGRTLSPNYTNAPCGLVATLADAQPKLSQRNSLPLSIQDSRALKLRGQIVLGLRQGERRTNTQREEDAENQAEPPEHGDTGLCDGPAAEALDPKESDLGSMTRAWLSDAGYPLSLGWFCKLR